MTLAPVPARRLILGIETSCDETAAAVVEDGCRVRSNIIASQHDLHAEYRGVVPEIASRAHAERLVPVVRAALAAANITLDDLDAVAVGNRPGLIGSLLVGVAGAKALAFGLRSSRARPVPVVPVDHVHAHLVAGRLSTPNHPPRPIPFPALGLVVSGGHTSLYLLDSPTRLRRLGATIDDAIGEAFDKVAATLNLPFPGGPNLDRLAQTATPLSPGFPLARIAPDSLDFSFSGLKTAALYAFRGVPESDWVRTKREKRNEPPAPTFDAPTVAATFQHAAVDTILLKLDRARAQFPAVRALTVGGGVSANSLLRARLIAFAAAANLELFLPPLEYCLDNGAMIAALAFDLLAEPARIAETDLAFTAVPTSAL